jgi:hypothetical protein
VSITAVVTNYIQFSGDQESEAIYGSGNLANSPAVQQLANLVDGNNTITVPSVEDFVVHGVAIVPPAGNTNQLTLKGASGDTGVLLSATDVSMLQFGDTVPTEIILFIEGIIDGLRLVWF